ncbi:MAG: hypothetical protein Q8S26_12110 [Azonexus sp.]|nr:hypothetical protein [Azonexus sp.]
MSSYRRWLPALALLVLSLTWGYTWVLGTPVVAILSSRLTFGEEFKSSEIAGILLIGSGLALLSLLSWAASRRNPVASVITQQVREQP